jgi:hypothetical protein
VATIPANENKHLTCLTRENQGEIKQWLSEKMANKRKPPDPNEIALGEAATKHKGGISSENVKRRLQSILYIRKARLARRLVLIDGEFDPANEEHIEIVAPLIEALDQIEGDCDFETICEREPDLEEGGDQID